MTTSRLYPALPREAIAIRSRRRHAGPRIWLLLVGVLLMAAPAHADRFQRLGQTLTEAPDPRQRVGAAVRLGRTGDHRAVPALMVALRDGDRTVRAVAAAALGRLGDRRPLVSLARVAASDPDGLVRKRAAEAIEAIASARREAAIALPAGRDAAAVERPVAARVHLTLASAAVAMAQADASERARQAGLLRRSLGRALARSPLVSTARADAARLPSRVLDASIIALSLAQRDTSVDVHCQVRVAISDPANKMQTFVSGGATVRVPRASFRSQDVPTLQADAIDGAVQGVLQRVVLAVDSQQTATAAR